MPRRTFPLAVAVIIVAALVIRLWNLDVLPAGANQDELLRGYDAYSLIRTGADHRGNPWPLYFEGFSRLRDNAPPLYTYLSIPSIAVFGLTLWAIRFTSVALGTLMVAATILFVRELTRRRAAPLLAGFFLALSPWHVLISRFGNEYVTLPLFATLGSALFLRGIRTRRLAWLCASAAAFAVGFSGYAPARLFLPLLGIILVVIHRRALLTFGRRLIIPAALFAALCAPTALLILRGEVLGRFREISVFSYGTSWPLHALGNWAAEWSPTGAALPLLSVVESALVILGLVAVIGTPGTPRVVLLAWMAAAPIPAALTVSAPHFGRSSALLPIPSVLAAVALVRLWEERKTIASRPALRFAAVLASAWFVIAALRSGSPYQFLSRPWVTQYFQPGLVETTAAVSTLAGDRVIITLRDVRQPYIYLLFSQLWDPSRLALARVPRPDGWEEVPAAGEYRFCIPDDCARPGDLVVARVGEIGDRQPVASYGSFVAVRW